MHKSIGLADTHGKTVKEFAHSYVSAKVLLQFTDDSILVLGAQTDSWGDAQIGAEDFDRHAFDANDLLCVFGEEQVAQWNREDDERHEQFLAGQREYRRQEYEKLKAEFEPMRKIDEDYGFQWRGILSWNYHLSAFCRFLSSLGRQIRWYGISIPWTQVGVGVIVNKKVKESQ